MDNQEKDLVFEGGDFSLEDFSLDMEDIEQTEVLEQNSFISNDSIQLARQMVDYSVDRTVRVLALNRAISIILNSSVEKVKARFSKHTKEFYTNMRQDSLMFADMIKTNLVAINLLCDEFRKEIARLKVEYKYSYQLDVSNTLVSNALIVVNNKIPKNIGPSVLKTYLGKLHDMITYNQVTTETIDLMEKILKELEMVAEAMSEVDVEDNDHISNSDDFISDNLVLTNGETVQQSEKYQLTNLALEDQLSKLLSLRNKLNKEDIFEEDIPSIYSLVDFSVTQDAVKYINATGTLVMAQDSTVPQNVTINYIEDKFSNRMHLIGITDKAVSVSMDNTGSSSTIVQLYLNEYNELLEQYELKEFNTDTSNIIEVPPVYFSTALNAIILVDNSSEDCSCKLFGDYVGETKPEKSNLEILLEVSRSRGFSTNPVYYTILTANSTNSNFARDARATRQTVIKTWNLKYSNSDLGKIALQTNIRKLLQIPSKEFDASTFELLHGHETREQKDQLIDVYTKMRSDLINWAPTVVECTAMLSLTKTMVYSKELTFNRNKLINLFYEYLQTYKGRIPSRLTIEKVYYENQEQIHARMAYDMLSKAEYEITALKEILGPTCEYDVYFREVLEGSDSPNYLMKKNLQPIDISDVLWLMLKLYKNGLYRSQIITKSSTKIKVSRNYLTPQEFVRFVVKTASEPTCLDDLWGYTIPNSKIVKKLEGYNTIRQALAQAYGMFFLIKDNIEEVNNLMYSVKNLTVKQYSNLVSTDVELMDKYNLTEDFYVNYMDYITKQINGISKANELDFPTEISCELLGKAYLQFMWNTRREDKQFTHQLANISVKKLPTTQQLIKHSSGAGAKINALITLRNDISSTNDVVERYLNICGLHITKPNEILSNLINQCIYMVSINVVYAYELYEYLLTVAKDGNLDDFGQEELKQFNIMKGFDGCNQPIIADNVYLASEYDKAFVAGKELFAIRDVMLLSQMLNKKFIRGLRNVPQDEQEAIDYIEGLYVSNMTNFTMEKSLKKLLIKLGTINKDDVTQALKYISNTLPTVWDEICLVQSLALSISTTETTHKYSIDMSRVTIKADKDIKQVEEKLLQLQEEATSLLRRGDILNILACYIACSVIIENNDKLEDVYREVQEVINENYNSIEDLIVKNERSLKKSIALYRQYLKKGDEQYLTEVDMNAIPFDLLTTESADNAVTGHYSKSYLKSIYSIVDENNPVAVASYYKTEYSEIFESIMEKEPHFYEEAPVAIKEYILEQERFNRSIVAGNFK